MTEGKYIRFIEARDLHTIVRKKLKTKVWNIVAKEDGTILGRIGWSAKWQGYVFFPYEGMMFEHVCSHDIGNFIEFQDLEHRTKARTSSKTSTP